MIDLKICWGVFKTKKKLANIMCVAKDHAISEKNKNILSHFLDIPDFL
jgi:hypothetical protein